VSAVSAGIVLGDRLVDPDGAMMVRLCAAELLSDSNYSRDAAKWFLTERNRVSPEALAYMSFEMGSPAMVYLALSGSDNVSDETLQRLLNDPERYLDGIPSAGSGTGDYSWVRVLGGGTT